ncbi:MAG TPA: DUF3568 family protein [Candidatus Acidoferrales bacterium]|jgi:hypothetical protein|nr:DUF3568 family protein [Candidatus Acidoferrales bacterium]
MKIKIFAALVSVGMILFTAGCVSTVSGTYTSGFPTSDKVVSRYQRSVDEVYAAAIAVINNNGVLLTEFIPHDTTNPVRALKAKVDKEEVYIRVEAVDPQITQVTIQARTNVGGDVQEAHELDKEILLQLAHQ